MNITIAQTKPRLGDIQYNLKHIKNAIKQATDIIVFPELALTGYSLQDLIFAKNLQNDVQKAIDELINFQPQTAIIIGYPKFTAKGILNTAGVIYKNQIIHEYYKKHLANFDCFNESRYFTTQQSNNIITINNYKIALAVCYDLWQPYPNMFVDAIISLNASPFSQNKDSIRNQVLQRVSINNRCPIIYANIVGFHDGIVFDGASRVIDKFGKLKVLLPSFVEATYSFDLDNLKTHQHKVSNDKVIPGIKFAIQEYCQQTKIQHAVIGISGGLDSAIVAALVSSALKPENVTGIFMPSIYTSQESKDLSYELCKNLNIKLISETIRPTFASLKKQLNSNNPSSNAEQNLQARIRGLILMYYANSKSGIVINTGNKSELAMGYCTMYGDMIGAIAPIGDLTKTQLFEYAKTIKEIPSLIIKRAPSAELAPDQKDSDQLPDYPILDKAINSKNKKTAFDYMIENKINQQEHKRQQAPMIIKLSTSCYNIDRKYPRLIFTDDTI